MLSYVANHSKQRKTTKPIKCYELHRLDVKTIKTKLNYKSDQNPMTCIDLTSKRSKMLSYVAKHSKQCKTTKPIKCNELHRLDVRTIKTMLNYKSDLNYKSHLNYKSDLNYKGDQNPMTCIDLTSKRSKMLSYVAKHSKQRKTTKPIKLQWIASIGCQNNQNKAKLQKWSKLQKWFKIQWLASIWRQNDEKCWVTSQIIQNNAKLQNRSNAMNCIDWMSKRSKQS